MSNGIKIEVKQILDLYFATIQHHSCAPVGLTMFTQEEVEHVILTQVRHQFGWSLPTPIIWDKLGNVVPLPNSGVVVTRPIYVEDVDKGMFPVSSVLEQEEIDVIVQAMTTPKDQ